MFYQLAPAGNPITLEISKNADQELATVLKSSHFRLYESGTSALAAAIKTIMAERGVDKAEILLPAYGCPEIVSAVIFAGASPVLVDLELNRPWLDLSDLESKITNTTIAIIAVDLFGIPERFVNLREICNRHDIALIEDSAQSFPSSMQEVNWQGDITVLSFGRGKPVSLLGGGGVICSTDRYYKFLPSITPKEYKSTIRALDEFIFRNKAKAYNLLLSPLLYWIPYSLPFLNLGKTEYHPLGSIGEFPYERHAYLSENIKAHWNRKSNFNGVKFSHLSRILNIELIDLPSVCCGDQLPSLIRYPILVSNKEEASRLYDLSMRRGLGVSRMYQKTLIEIEGLGVIFKGQGPFPNAEQFAETLLTLPIHSKVPANYLELLSRR